MPIVALLLLIAMILVGVMVLNITVFMVWYLLAGLVVGAVARLVLPGKERIGLLGTILVGLAGGALGGVVGRALGAGRLLEFVLSVAAAALLLTVLGYRR